MKQRAIKESAGDRTVNAMIYFVLFIFSISVLYPLIFIFSASFSSPEAVLSGKVRLWPVGFSLAGYEAVFKYKLIGTGFVNSLFYTGVGTLINVVFTLMAAYPLSRKDFYIRNWIMALFVFTMLFSGGMIPSYLLVKNLGMLNTVWAMVIPGAIGIWNVIIARTYFRSTLPDELLEAAQMDGCSDFRYIGRIVLPLSGPIVAVITLFYAVAHWNSFFNAMLYLKDQSLYPLQLVLREILVQNQVDSSMIVDVEETMAREGLREQLKYSLIVISMVPMLIVYPFIQKHFVKGMMIGSLKG